jgi:hypothetical protein
MSRYKIVDGSLSAHCCFEATVVDTTKPEIVNGEHYKNIHDHQLQYEPVCECFTREDAEVICNALNATSKG